MGKMIAFPAGKMTAEELLSMDVAGMEREELLALLPQIEMLYEDMEADEPEDPESPEYYDWAGRMEELDDLMDEIQDLLEE